MATAETVRTTEKVEYTGKHLEAAFVSRARYHKGRILEAFGAEGALSPIPKSDTATEFVESEKRYRKATSVLYREEVMEVPPIPEGITRDYLIALADNLAWRGLENSIISTHLAEVQKIIHKLSARHAGKAATGRFYRPAIEEEAQMRDHAKVLKALVVTDNHFYRDFFASGQAADFKLGSPAAMERFLDDTFITGRSKESTARIARGISLEIAAKAYLSDLLAKDGRFSPSDEAIVAFGYEEEDRKGGDIVVLRGDNVLYIDLKNKRPDGAYNEDETERGFRLSSGRDYSKAVIWPETSEPVANDSFRLTDPTLRNSLQKLLLETR